MFSIDPTRLSSLVAQSDAAQIATRTANDALRQARADLRVAEQNLADAERRGNQKRSEELRTFVDRAREEVGRCHAEHERLTKISRTAGGIARNATDYAVNAGIRL